jgi:hypothetical protein
MPGVQFVDQIDMNTGKVTEMGPGTAGTDAVNLNQLNAIAPQGFAQSIGNGALTTFTVTHGFSTLDVMVEVFDNVSGATATPTVTRTTVNDITVSFLLPPSTNQYRVLVIPVP